MNTLLLAPFVGLVVASISPRQQLGQPVWGGYNITEEVLRTQSAISSPNCNATTPCIDFVAWIPKCLALHGDPGCWCSNPDPLHYCAICMSSPADNTTNPQQTQDATVGHADYHKGCNAYEAFLNASLTSTSSALPSTTSTSLTTSATAAAANAGGSSLNSGALAGVVIGGIIGVVLIVAAAWLAYRHMQNKHEATIAATTVQAQSPHLRPVQPSWYDEGMKYNAPTGGMSEMGGAVRPLPTPGRPMTGSSSPPPPFTPYTPHTPQGQGNLPGGGNYSVERTPGGYDASVLSDLDTNRFSVASTQRR